jgi:hypothetical protein
VSVRLDQNPGVSGGRRVLLALALALAPAGALAAPSGCDAIAGNLVVNCGFETDSISLHPDVGSGWRTESVGGGGIGLIGPGDAITAFGGGSDHSGASSYRGLNQVTLGVLVGNLNQDIPTIVGHTYEVDFFEKLFGAATSNATIFAQINAFEPAGGTAIDVEHVDSLPFSGDYQRRTGTFVADSTVSNLDFNVIVGGPNFSVAWELDDVSVVDVTPAAAVPEPTPWTLAIGGFGMAGGALRRRGRLAQQPAAR